MTQKKEEIPKNDRLDSSYAAFKELISEFKNESDRAAVILGAAKLDYLLYQILYKFLLPNVGSRDELLDGDSPLATFSSRINMCHRLGIIDAEFARALHLLRRIRNAFAHEMVGSKLDSGTHRDRVRELTAPLERFRAFEKTKQIYFSDKSGISASFFTALAVMIARLEGAFEYLKPLESSTPQCMLIPLHYLKGQDKEENKKSSASNKEQDEAKGSSTKGS
jgi:hypothetical protein